MEGGGVWIWKWKRKNVKWGRGKQVPAWFQNKKIYIDGVAKLVWNKITEFGRVWLCRSWGMVFDYGVVLVWFFIREIRPTHIVWVVLGCDKNQGVDSTVSKGGIKCFTQKSKYFVIATLGPNGRPNGRPKEWHYYWYNLITCGRSCWCFETRLSSRIWIEIYFLGKM